MNMHSYGGVADTCPQDSELRRLMENRGLHPVYQPILDVRNGNYLACEALIRRPEDSALHMPTALFAAAAAANVTHQFERLKIRGALQCGNPIRRAVSPAPTSFASPRCREAQAMPPCNAIVTEVA